MIRSRLDGEVLKSQFVAKMRPRSLVDDNDHEDDDDENGDDDDDDD